MVIVVYGLERHFFDGTGVLRINPGFGVEKNSWYENNQIDGFL